MFILHSISTGCLKSQQQSVALKNVGYICNALGINMRGKNYVMFPYDRREEDGGNGVDKEGVRNREREREKDNEREREMVREKDN